MKKIYGVVGEREPQKPFRTLELNLLFRWVAICSRRSIEAGFYGKSSTWKIAPKKGISLP